MGTVAEAPVAGAVLSNKDKNKARLELLKQKKAGATAAKAAGNGKVAGTPSTAKVAREKKEKVVRPCKCGCGGQTTAFFLPGHDARFKGWLLKIERGTMEVKDLPPSIQKEYKWVKHGKGMRPTLDYKGNPHTGYEEASE